MNSISKDEKIEKYLNELSDEYKELLFKALIAQSESIENLSVSDLLRIDAEIKKTLMEDYRRIQKRRNRLRKVGMLYLLMGAYCFILFQAINLIRNGYFTPDKLLSLLAIMISFLGIFAFALSFMEPRKSLSRERANTKTKEKPVLEYEIIHNWRELEGKVNDISEGDSVKTPRSIIGFLSESHFIDDNESKILQELLRMRNNIVHNTGVEYSANELEEIIQKSNHIISKIDKNL